jgi:hypothetical protein
MNVRHVCKCCLLGTLVALVLNLGSNTGQALDPGASRFEGGIRRGPSGNFLGVGRTDGNNMFPTPWRPVEPVLLLVTCGIPGYTFAVLGPDLVIAPQEQPGPAPSEPPPLSPWSTPGPPPSDIWFRSPVPSETTTPVIPGSAGSYGPRKSPGWNVAGVPGGDSTVAKDPFKPSPGISARISRLAQAGGVQTLSGVQVDVRDTTATVRGAVATPYQRSLVGNLVSMEPGVWHVDNQVIVVAAPELSATQASRYSQQNKE